MKTRSPNLSAETGRETRFSNHSSEIAFVSHAFLSHALLSHETRSPNRPLLSPEPTERELRAAGAARGMTPYMAMSMGGLGGGGGYGGAAAAAAAGLGDAEEGAIVVEVRTNDVSHNNLVS